MFCNVLWFFFFEIFSFLLSSFIVLWSHLIKALCGELWPLLLSPRWILWVRTLHIVCRNVTKDKKRKHLQVAQSGHKDVKLHITLMTLNYGRIHWPLCPVILKHSMMLFRDFLSTIQLHEKCIEGSAGS